MRRLLGLCCFWLCASAQAQTLPPPPDTRPPETRKVTVATDDSDRMSVPVSIGGKLWHFLVDTASTRSVIASDVADNLKLAPGASLNVLNIGGIDTVPSVMIPELGFSDFAVHNINAPSLLRSNLGGDGLLGLDILRNNRLSIDFRSAVAMTIAPSSRPPERGTDDRAKDDDGDTIVVVGKSRLGALIVTNAEVEGIHVTVILDTGAQESIGNPALAKALFRAAARSRPQSATLISVTGRTLPADYTVIHTLRLGGIGIANVPMAFGDLATFRQLALTRRPAILLGMETLRLFSRVTIDFPRHEIRFLLHHEAMAGASQHPGYATSSSAGASLVASRASVAAM